MSEATVQPIPHALVATILDEGFKLALNRGRVHGVQRDVQYIVYARGPEVIDPETGKLLGQVEIVRGRGVVIQVEEEFCIIESAETQASIGAPQDRLLGGLGSVLAVQRRFIPAPFKRVEVGDHARPI